MFDALHDRFSAAFKSLRGKRRLSPEDVDTVMREIRLALLEADVALPVVRSFVKATRERLLGAEVSEALEPAQQVVKVVDEELVRILGGEARPLRLEGSPAVVMLVGLQGAGKTTLAGKLARHLAGSGRSPLLVAADLQRPNAVTQLQVVASRAGVPVFAPEPGNGVGDPVEVAAAGLEEARRLGADVVVVDTAGRLGIDAELMGQASRIRDAVSPDEVLFVLDAMAGQDAVNTAASFLEGVDFTGVVLTKLDGDARGGAALSVASVTGRPILFASNGEGLDDFDVFHPDRIASRILGMGDVLTLIEKAEKAFDAEQVERMAATLGSGQDFTLDDFLSQMRTVRSMGSLTKLLGMLPGMGDVRAQLESFDERELDRVEAIISSMTPSERREPRILDRSRRSRVARGSGVPVQAVDDLLLRFADAQKMMKQMMSGGGPALPGMPGMGGMPGLPGMGGMPGLPVGQPPRQRQAGKSAPKRPKRPKTHHKKKKR